MSFTYVNKIWLIGSAFQLELHSWYHWRMQLKGIEQDILVYKGLEKTELLRTFLIKVCYLEKKPIIKWTKYLLMYIITLMKKAMSS